MGLLSLSGTDLFVSVIALVLLVGFASDFLAKRLRIPDVIWLILLGLVLGPGLGLISSHELLVIAPILGVVALVLILFDAGLDMHIDRIRTIFGPALLFSATAYAASVAVLFVVALLIFPSEGTLAALLFALSLGCTSGAIVIPLTRRLRLPERLSRMVQLEAAFEDMLAIVAVTALLLVVAAPPSSGSALHLALTLALPIPVGIAVGVGGGLVWRQFLSSWQDEPYAALATLGFVLAVYVVADFLGGSGILAALALGIVLANEGIFQRWLGEAPALRLAPSLRKVQGELAFLLRSFFLLLLGMLVDLREASPFLWATLVIAAVVLVVVRLGAALRLGGPANRRAVWGPTLAGLYGRGLTSAVLIVVAFARIPSASALVLPGVMLVLLTNVVMTIWLVYLGRTGELPQAQFEEPPTPDPELYSFAP
jgi:potassium/hydrogen antiporter